MRKKEKQSTRGRNRTYIVAGFTFVFLVVAIIWVGSNKQDEDQLVENRDQGEEFQESSPSPDEPANHIDKNLPGTAKSDKEPLRKIEKAPLPSEPFQEKPVNPTGYIEGQELLTEPKYVKGIVLANKQYPLPKDYAPGESPVAREAFNELAAAAVTSGINLQAFSTYRSYEYQVTLYNRYVERDGQEAADRYSARPGYSEHQTGLAFDIGEVNHEQHWASTSFGGTEAARWLASNAYKYGFILRYPEDKEEVTGYMHESWHYRFVGKEAAQEIFKQNITLEEYMHVQ